MKTLLALFLLFFSGTAFACKCGEMALSERIFYSDFIAKAKIKKIWPNQENDDTHNIEIEILNLYKGTPANNLQIYSLLSTSCSFYTPENTTWLILASEDTDGTLKFGFCSGSQKVETDFNSVQRKTQVLQYLKTNNLNLTTKNDVEVYIDFDFFVTLKGLVEPKNNFALYEIVINEDLTVKTVKPIKEFQTDEVNIEIPSILKNHASVQTKNGETTLSEEQKIILPLYYYPKEQNYKSFISYFDL